MAAKVETILQPTAEDNKANQEAEKVEVVESDLNSADDASGELNR